MGSQLPIATMGCNQKAEDQESTPSLIYRKIALFFELLETPSHDIGELLIEGEDAAEASNFINLVMPQFSERVKSYDEGTPQPIQIESQIETAYEHSLSPSR